MPQFQTKFQIINKVLTRNCIMELENDSEFVRTYRAQAQGRLASGRRALVDSGIRRVNYANYGKVYSHANEQMRRYFDKLWGIPDANFADSDEYSKAPTIDLFKDDDAQPVKRPPSVVDAVTKFRPLTQLDMDRAANWANSFGDITKFRMNMATLKTQSDRRKWMREAGYFSEKPFVRNFELQEQVLRYLCKRYEVPIMPDSSTHWSKDFSLMPTINLFGSAETANEILKNPLPRPLGAAADPVQNAIEKAGNEMAAQLLTLTDGREMTAEQFLQSEKETIMNATTNITITNITYVNGIDVSKMSNAAIYDVIQNQEVKMAQLEGIKNKPKALKQQLKDMQDGIDALVALVDSRTDDAAK